VIKSFESPLLSLIGNHRPVLTNIFLELRRISKVG